MLEYNYVFENLKSIAPETIVKDSIPDSLSKTKFAFN
ncbi:MAG: hypothetical protein ACI93S_001262 [Ancylomarina sp.]|jgi:hypothetical protein